MPRMGPPTAALGYAPAQSRVSFLVSDETITIGEIVKKNYMVFLLVAACPHGTTQALTTDHVGGVGTFF